MNFEEIWKQIKQIKSWYNIGSPSVQEYEEEILKPLNKIIDFENQECFPEDKLTF